MCGMTRKEDVDHAVKLGADAIGLIFYSKSPRGISIQKAHELIDDLPPFIDKVAVLVNPDEHFVAQIINELPISLLQFHGDESPDFCQQFARPYIKAINPVTTAQIEQAADYFTDASALLLDAASSTSRGGTGLTFDWSIIPQKTAKPLILAGGLNELNVVDALQLCHPYAVDVCSGIEALPGIKDHIKMSLFMKAVWG